MTQFSPTLGPWSRDDGNPVKIMGRDGVAVSAIYGGFQGGSEQYANADLIVAAPTMYKYIEQIADGGDAKARRILATIEKPPPVEEDT